MAEKVEMSNKEATAERYEPKRFLCDMSDCVDGGDSCKAQMKTSTTGAFVYHSDYTQLLAEVGRLREALEPFMNNGSVFIFHRNVEIGDYFECLFCNREGPRWREIPHNQKCLIAIAGAALTGKGEGE